MLFWILIGLVCTVLFFFTIGLLGFFWGSIFGVPFVPTPQKTVDAMVQVAGDIKNKKVYDLGCGDGRLIFSASEQGAKSIGVEISFPVYLLARLRKIIRQWKKKPTGKIIWGSLWNIELQDADVIFFYLLPPMMKRFEAEIIPILKPGCLLISHGFKFPNTPIHKEIKRSKSTARVLVYRV